MELDYRNAKRLVDGRINCEINHPELGWIPITTAEDDAPTSELYRRIDAAGDAAPVTEADEVVALQRRRAGMVVSAFQARAALSVAGYLEAVQAYMSGPDVDPLTAIAWEKAQEFRRLSPTVAEIAGELELTDTQLDDLFLLAATIEA